MIFFRNQSIRNKNRLWWPCLLTDQNEISNLYRGPSIDAFYQVSVYLAEGFQRRRLKCEKLTDDRWRLPSDGKSLHCLWQGELKRWRRYKRRWHVLSWFYFHYLSFEINFPKKCIELILKSSVILNIFIIIWHLMEFKNKLLFHHCYHRTIKLKPTWLTTNFDYNIIQHMHYLS